MPSARTRFQRARLRGVKFTEMTAYIVNHRKKKAILEKRVAGLQHAVKNSFSREKIEKEVEKVRAAKLAIFKMEFSKNTTLPAHSYEPQGEALVWESMAVEDILSEYKLCET